MSTSRFKAALAERDRTRELLAEALDSKFELEARRRTHARFVILLLACGVGYLTVRGVGRLNALFRPLMNAQKHGAPRPDVLAQMKKQMAEGDPMLIAGEPKAPPPSGPRRTRGGADDFASEKVPINLVPELKNPRGAGNSKNAYDPAGPRAKQEIEQLAARAARNPPPDYGKYRPGLPDDLRKLPKPGAHAAPSPELYVRLPGPPAALAEDEHEFPPEQSK